MNILIDSDHFWKELKVDIAKAKKNVYVQTFAFEGDEVGEKFCDALLNSSAADIKIIADSFTRHIVSDKIVHLPSSKKDQDLQKEIANTQRLSDELTMKGIQLKYVNPVGFLFHKMPIRNHKKIVIIDDEIAYIGGINFCDHNFAWHDMMVRITDKNLVSELKNDFNLSWDGTNQSLIKNFSPHNKMIIWDGKHNKAGFTEILNLLDNAEKSIFIESPYLAFPFYKNLAAASKRGVKVTIVNPEENNQQSLKRYAMWESQRNNFDLYLYQRRMAHLKGIMVDDKFVVVGSTNFDFLSYKCEQELALISSDPELVKQFRQKVVIPDTSSLYSKKFTGHINNLWGHLHRFVMKSMGWITLFFARI